MKSRVLVSVVVMTGIIVLSYSACSPFHSLDSVNNSLSTSTDLNSSNVPIDQNNQNGNQNGNSPMVTPMPLPSPQTQNPTPTPMPNTGGNTSTPIACPNMPSGATVVMETPFNTTDGEGQLWEVYPGAGKIMQPTGVNGNANASVLSAGQGVGGQQTIWPKIGKEQPLSNLYVCMRWKMNKDFIGLRTNNKLIFIAAQDFPFGQAESNGVLSVPARDGYPLHASYQMVFGHNSGNLNNAHACTYGIGEVCYPNAKDTPIYPDTWYIIEAYVASSTCITCRNATVKWWVNGELNGNYTNLNYGSGIVNEFQINHTWDGGSDKQCGPPTNPSNVNGRDCRKDQIHYFDHVILASVGGKASGK